LLETPALARWLYPRADPSGLEPNATQVLLSISLEDDVATPRLAERLTLSQGTIRYALNKLEARGLIAESASGPDARKRQHRLTPEGRRVVNDFVARSRALLEEWTDKTREC